MKVLLLLIDLLLLLLDPVLLKQLLLLFIALILLILLLILAVHDMLLYSVKLIYKFSCLNLFGWITAFVLNKQINNIIYFKKCVAPKV